MMPAERARDVIDWRRTYPWSVAGDDPRFAGPHDDDERLAERRALAAAVLESAQRLVDQLTQALRNLEHPHG
jgi:hypothetical protein